MRKFLKFYENLGVYNKIHLYHINLSFRGRDFVVAIYPDKKRQLFYRSTGRNSNKPGVWFPFDGIVMRPSGHLWFEKSRYVIYDGEGVETGVPEELDRYGTSELKEISDYLGKCEILFATNEEPRYWRVNAILRTKDILFTENEKLKVLPLPGYLKGGTVKINTDMWRKKDVVYGREGIYRIGDSVFFERISVSGNYESFFVPFTYWDQEFSDFCLFEEIRNQEYLAVLNKVKYSMQPPPHVVEWIDAIVFKTNVSQHVKRINRKGLRLHKTLLRTLKDAICSPDIEDEIVRKADEVFKK
jgi:hypothetical protein